MRVRMVETKVAAATQKRVVLVSRRKQGDGCLKGEEVAEHKEGEKLMTIWFVEKNNPPVEPAD